MIRGLIGAAMLTAVVAGPLLGQDEGCQVLCSPVFVAQPGLVITNAVGAPEGASAKTDFNLRFTTVLPTQLSRLALVALFQWTPGEAANAPGIAYGGVITLVRPQDTGGWLDVSFDPLGVYSPDGRPGAEHAYNNKLDFEGALGLHLFQKLPRHDWFEPVTLYGLVDYLATGLPSGADRWVILTGLTIPLAPWRR